MDGLLIALFMALVVALTILASPRALRAIRDWRTRLRYGPTRKQRKEWAKQLECYQAEFRAANPEGPPISDEEHTAFQAWLQAQQRPALHLMPDPALEVGPDGCRLGGSAWLAEFQEWPLSPRGNPLEFLAQLDFAQLPALAGFPATGVVQFFIPSDDDVWGVDFDDPLACEAHVVFRPNGSGTRPGQSPRATDPTEDFTPFIGGDSVRDCGIALSAAPFVDRIPFENWRVGQQFDGNRRRPGFEQWEASLTEQTDSAPLMHHIGGYPSFVQSDFRGPGKFEDYDICLLRLTSDDYVQWGDVGEANFLIRSTDLEANDFSKVIFWWDCS